MGHSPVSGGNTCWGLACYQGNVYPYHLLWISDRLFFFFREGRVVIQKMLICCQMEKVIFVSIQVAKSTDGYRAPTVRRGLERACLQSQFKDFQHYPGAKMGRQSPGLEGSCHLFLLCPLCERRALAVPEAPIPLPPHVRASSHP